MRQQGSLCFSCMQGMSERKQLTPLGLGKLGLTQDAADAMLQVGSSDPTSMLCAVLGIYLQTRQAAKGKSTCLAKLLLCSWQRMGKPLP